MSNAHDDAGTKAKAHTSPRNPRTQKKKLADAKRAGDGKFTEANDKTWKKGQSGNPAGRRRSRTLSESYRDKLAEPCELETSMTWAEYIAHQQVHAAAGLRRDENSTAAARELADRTEGKARQAIDLDVKGEAKALLAMLLGVDPDDLPDPQV